MNDPIKYIPMYKSYIDAVSKLSPEDRLIIYEAIFEYGFTGVEPVFENPYLEMGWNLVKPNLVNNISNLKKQASNGSKGGRPSKKIITSTKENIDSNELKTVEVIKTITNMVKPSQFKEKMVKLQSQDKPTLQDLISSL